MTHTVTLPADTYTLVTSNSTLLVNPSSKPIRISVKATLPASTTKDFIPLGAGERLTLLLADGVNIYAYSETSLDLTYSDQLSVPEVIPDAIIQEDGFFILTEDGFKILVET